MLSLQSPHHKPQLLQSAISPSYRNKRIPSAHDNYSYSSNHNLKICRVESPSKASQKLKRRKSQYINSSSSYLDNNKETSNKNDRSERSNEVGMQYKKKSSSKSTKEIISINHPPSPLTNIATTPHNPTPTIFPTNPIPTTPSSFSKQPLPLYPQSIITQMNCLKNQYKQLKSAYQQLIEDKISNSEKMALIRQENRKLEAELEVALNKVRGDMGHNGGKDCGKDKGETRNQKDRDDGKGPRGRHSRQVSDLSSGEGELQSLRLQNQRLKEKNSFYESQLDRIKKECYKLLQAEKFKTKKLEQSLKEKETDDLLKVICRGSNNNNQYYNNSSQSQALVEQYSSSMSNFTNLNPNLNLAQNTSPRHLLIRSTRQQPHNQNPKNTNIIMSTLSPRMVPLTNNHNNNNTNRNDYGRNDTDQNQNNNNYNKPTYIPNVNLIEESLFISQDRSLLDCIDTSNNNCHNNSQSQFISISLTSVMEESTVCKIQDQDMRDLLVKQQHQYQKQGHRLPLTQLPTNQTQSTQTVLPSTKQPHKRQKPQPSTTRLLLQAHPQQPTIIPQQPLPTNNLKKMRKQVHQKLQLNLNHFQTNITTNNPKKESFMNLKTPLNNNNGEKKLMKNSNKNSKSKKKEEDKDKDKENIVGYGGHHHGNTNTANYAKDYNNSNNAESCGNAAGKRKKEKNHSLTSNNR